MAKTVVKIPNFISGVSQQIPELRFPAQMEQQINGLPSIKNGFGKRYPVEHVVKLPATLDAFNQWHFIDRGSQTHPDPFTTDFDTSFGDSLESTQYAVAFGDGAIEAVNLKGQTEEIVIVGDSLTYLKTKDPKNDLDFITIQDFTWILNKKVTTLMSTVQDTFRPFEALIFVAKSRQYSDYKIFINDVEEATFIQGAASASMSTNQIATNMEADLLLNLDLTKFSVIRSASTIYVGSIDGIDFSIRTEEGDGGETLKVFKGSTSKFSSLPSLAINGFRIKIENDPDFDEDNFWVEYISENITDQGKWKESRQSGLFNTIDKTTMPHQLIHNTKDIFSTDFTPDFGIQTFTLSPVTWDDRLVGDDTSVPLPSFLKSTINDIFFMRNRLGFLSGENVIQSENNQAKNFWITTLQTLLDTETIDVGTSHSKSSTFRHAVPTQERLLLFTRDTHFIYGSGDNILSPKTVFINPSSEVTINEKVRPFVSGSSVFFAVDKKKGTSIKEMSILASDELMSTQDITAHVPDYIPKDLQQIDGSNIDQMLFFLSNDEPDALFVYKFLNEGNTRILSSWHKWTFGGEAVVIGGFKGILDNLYGIYTYEESGTVTKHLQRINLSPDHLNTGLGHALMLDRLITVKGVYDSTVGNSGTTTWNLPYQDEDTLKIILGSTFSVPGQELTQASITQSGKTLTYPGDFSSGVVHIGKKYETSTTLTQPMLKTVDNNAPVVDRTATYTVHTFTTDFYKSSGFQVDVTYKDGTVRPYKYSGYLTENTDFTIGQFNFNSDSWSVPIRTKQNRKVIVKIYDAGYVPFNIYSGRWIMNVTRKKGRF